jgi:hypothetical protein
MFFLLPSGTYTNKSEDFRHVSMPHTSVYVGSMDFPNLVHTFVAIVDGYCKGKSHSKLPKF